LLLLKKLFAINNIYYYLFLIVGSRNIKICGQKKLVKHLKVEKKNGLQ